METTKITSKHWLEANKAQATHEESVLQFAFKINATTIDYHNAHNVVGYCENIIDTFDAYGDGQSYSFDRYFGGDFYAQLKGIQVSLAEYNATRVIYKQGDVAEINKANNTPQL